MHQRPHARLPPPRLDARSLFDYHARLEKPVGPRAIVSQLRQVGSGIEYLHSMDPPVLHRDLKSANILIAETDKGNGARLAIADFGLARYQTSDSRMTAETGSYRWMAPEVIRHEPYNELCDVYSFALLGWEMLTNGVPFDGRTPVEAALAVAREGNRPPIPASTPQPLSQIIVACWQQDARSRPPMAEVVRRLDAIDPSALTSPTTSPRSPLRHSVSLKRPSSFPSGLAAMG